MAKVKVGINGFGRIGRVLFRAAFDNPNVEIAGVNSLDEISGLAHLLKYDSSHGVFNHDVSYDEKNLIIDGKKVPVSRTKKPNEIPWKDWGVEMVFECTGAFKKREDFLVHLEAGAKKVLVSAPADGADLTVVYGINQNDYDPSKHIVVSNASCTTNCLAPVAKVINDTFGIENGMMTTIHSYTNDQRVLDSSHKDLRRARTAGASMIPTSTGAAKAIGLVLPELKGKLDGTSVRVPTPNVSLVDLTVNLKTEASVSAINEAFILAEKTSLNGILTVEKKPLVSIDFNGNKFSSIVDLPLTMMMGPKTAKVMAWYDNETGFSYRMIDLAVYMASKGL